MSPLIGLNLVDESHHGSCAAHGRPVGAGLMMGHLLPHHHFRRVDIGMQHDPPGIVEAIIILTGIGIEREHRREASSEHVEGDLYCLDRGEWRDVGRCEATVR